MRIHVRILQSCALAAPLAGVREEEAMSDDAEGAALLDKDGLDALIRALSGLGRTVVGPTVRDGAIVLAEISAAKTFLTAGALNSRPDATACVGARTARPSRTAPARSPGRTSCTRNARGSGARSGRPTAR